MFSGARDIGRDNSPTKGLKIGDWRKLGYPILLDGKIIDRGGNFFDLQTGKRTGEKLPTSYGGCGSWCMSTHGVHGMCGTVYDRDAKAHVRHRIRS